MPPNSIVISSSKAKSGNNFDNMKNVNWILSAELVTDSEELIFVVVVEGLWPIGKFQRGCILFKGFTI